MTAFRDDRDKNSVKAEQERKIREARVAAGLPAYEHPNHKPSQNALTSYQDDEEDDEDPNPHGMLRMPGGGHVLGEEEAKPDASPS